MKSTSAKQKGSRKSPVAALRAQFEAHLQRASQSNLTWRDLLSALTENAMIAEDAALLLHAKLKVPHVRGAVETNPRFWIRQLARRNLSPDQRVAQQRAITAA